MPMSMLELERALPAPATNSPVLMSRYEKTSTIITSNRVVEDWPKMLGESSWRRCSIG